MGAMVTVTIVTATEVIVTAERIATENAIVMETEIATDTGTVIATAVAVTATAVMATEAKGTERIGGVIGRVEEMIALLSLNLLNVERADGITKKK